MDKDQTIERIYTDPAGFGSLKETLKEANKIDPTITIKDIKEWIEKNTHRRNNLPGYNSYIAPGPKHEYQIDLFFMSDLKDEDQQKFKVALCAIDSFTRFLTVIPLKSKGESDFLAGLMEAFKNLGGKPSVIYADQEPSWSGRYVQRYLKEENIKLITTLSHAPIVERAIGTIKNMLYKRLEFEPSKPWWGEVLQQVIFVYNYGRTHSTLEMTPNEARKPTNEERVKRNLKKHATYGRKYPEIKVGDLVRVFRKKDKLDKQQKSVWTKQRYTVENIIKENNQNFYKTSYSDNKLLLRHEILKT